MSELLFGQSLMVRQVLSTYYLIALDRAVQAYYLYTKYIVIAMNIYYVDVDVMYLTWYVDEECEPIETGGRRWPGLTV